MCTTCDPALALLKPYLSPPVISAFFVVNHPGQVGEEMPRLVIERINSVQWGLSLDGSSHNSEGRFGASRLLPDPDVDRDGSDSDFSDTLLTRRGPERWADVTASVIEYHGGPAVPGIAFDVTDRRRAAVASTGLMLTASPVHSWASGPFSR